MAAKLSVEVSLSMLGPEGRFGSGIFGGICAKYFGGNGGVASTFSVEFSLRTLEPVDGFGSEMFGGIVAKYFGASGWVWQRNVRWNFR